MAAAIPNIKVADPQYNIEQIENLAIQADGKGVEIITFPELCLTGYTCQDLFAQQVLQDETEIALMKLMEFSRSLDIIIVVGLPVPYQGSLLNCAAVLQQGKILGLVPKTYLPNYKEFYERRWFTSANDIAEGAVWICGQQIPLKQRQLFVTPSCTFGIEICEDVWAPIPPSSNLAMKGAEVILNLSADNDCVGKYSYVKNLISQQSARCICGYVYVGCGFGESTQDVVFGSKALICENGSLLAEGKRHSLESQLVITEIDIERLRSERRMNTTFAACTAHIGAQAPVSMVETDRMVQRDCVLTRTFNPHPFVPQGPALDERCEEIFDIQTEALAKRLRHTGSEVVVVGVSGGLDSTLALLVCVKTFDMLGLNRRGIVGITMPGFGTTDRTYTNAVNLMKNLGITIREIDITEACTQHFQDLGHDMDQHDVTYENGQARERTQILMDAANQMNGLVIGTGDLSELALGWATYNGDHMSMYGVNTSVPKTLVKHLVGWVAGKVDDSSRTILLDIIDTPISPELIPADENGEIKQKTEDLVGPYELHDFFLYYVLRWGFRPRKIKMMAEKAFNGKYDEETIKKWLSTFCRRFFQQQFKRSCLPDGPKVGSCSLSPRGDWRMPTDASAAAWLADCK